MQTAIALTYVDVDLTLYLKHSFLLVISSLTSFCEHVLAVILLTYDVAHFHANLIIFSFDSAR